MIVTEMKALLDLFEYRVPDKESNRLVWRFCDEREKWIKAHGLHSTIRNRNLKAIKQGDKAKESQYCFEEVIAKTLFNLTRPNAPFDPDSPYWVIKNALILAMEVGVPVQEVANIVAPNNALQPTPKSGG